MTRPPADLEFEQLKAEQLKAREIKRLLEHKPTSRRDSNLAAPVSAVVAARIQRARSRGPAAGEENPRQRSSQQGLSRQI